MFALTATILCLTVTDPVDVAIAKAARFYDGRAAYAGMREDLRAWQEGTRELRGVALACPEAEWPQMRNRLVAALDHENRGVWHACLSAIVRREGAGAVDLLLQQIENSGGEARTTFAARQLARIGPRLSAASRTTVVTTLLTVFQDFSRSMDRGQLMVAMGSMGDVAIDDLLRIGADETLRELVRSALPHALACTGDVRTVPLLLSLHEGAISDGERIASILALGLLVRRVGDEEPSATQAIAAIRADFMSHVSPEVGAVAGLAFARIGRLSGNVDTARVFALADNPAARKNALRAVLESRIPLGTEHTQMLEMCLQDEESSPMVRKIASALLALAEPK
ncbi:MAG: hypothetical protein KAV82_10615 [Phycisphaerae bacterium]|nr:hypothetical protein [Phycisphaerae bacterium]